MRARRRAGRDGGPVLTRSDGAAARIDRAQALRAWTLQLVEIERHAYEPVLEALRIERTDPEREGRIARARATASGSPLNIARAGSELATLAAECAEHTSPHLGEAFAAARLAAGASRAAAEIVQINLRGQSGDPRLSKAGTFAEVAEAAVQEVATRASG